MASNSGVYQRAKRPILSFFFVLWTFPAKCLEVLQSLGKTNPGSFSKEQSIYLSNGKSGAVYGIDDERVWKQFLLEPGQAAIEHRAYQRIGSHPNIVKLLATLEDGSIILERGKVLREVCRSPLANEIPIQRKLRWLTQAATGYQHLHDCNIIHADVGCNNMILTKKDNLKLIDFEGCSIDNEPADACYEWFSYKHSIPQVTRKTDIFAFGCAIYEVMTGLQPYHELQNSAPGTSQVQLLYADNNFPDVTSIPLDWLILRCWQGDFNSMNEVIQELEAFRPSPMT